jgi:general secretion pathway protein A
MYHQYFGLSEAPFSIAVNPRYLFMSARHRDALAHLLYGVGAGGGFILLTGEVGTGKTTINRCLLEQLPDDTDVAIILNPALNAVELLASVCDELNIEYDVNSHSLKALTDHLHRFLLSNYAAGRKTVLMIDEAQHLDFDVLEQIRLLTNLETNSEKLLQIILIGQPELAQLLSRPELRQLSQRITARYNLGPLNLDETRAYIRHRLDVAGLAPGREIFSDALVRELFKITRGIPRLINVLCDRVLLGAYGQNKLRADRSMLREAAREVMGEVEPSSEYNVYRIVAAVLIVLCVLLAAASTWLYFDFKNVAQGIAAPIATVQSSVIPVAETVQSPTKVNKSMWFLSRGMARAALWRINTTQPIPQGICSAEITFPLSCVTATAQTWQELQAIARPMVLEMVSPERFAGSAILLEIQGRVALLKSGQGFETVNLAELAPYWTGSYQFFWHPPMGFSEPLSKGDRSATVAEVAKMFALLDGQSQYLTESLFNTALERRVVMFQNQHDLTGDGVVGIQTLLKLNESLNLDVTSAVARQTLENQPATMAIP